MQRDLKVGLSLGVLVLGVVGALLFRREPVNDLRQPMLKTARKLDERIAERSRTPYMTGDVEFDAEPSGNAGQPGSGTPSARPEKTRRPAWLGGAEDQFLITDADLDNMFEPPSGVIDGVSPLKPTEKLPPVPGNVVAPQTHTIAAGDSLSMLAGRYLGSQARYHEIFEANRDVLTDVNRLPLGATIIIPPADKPSASVPGPEVASATRSRGPTTARSAMASTTVIEPVRAAVTDVSAIELLDGIEPIAPPSDDAPGPTARPSKVSPPSTALPVDSFEELSDSAFAPIAPPATPATPVVPKAHETKRFVAPSRLPFSNRYTPPTPVAPTPRKRTAAVAAPETSDVTSDQTAEPRYYQVRRGDSLERISLRVYGTARRASEIYAANRGILSSPNALREGQELVLPD